MSDGDFRKLLESMDGIDEMGPSGGATDSISRMDGLVLQDELRRFLTSAQLIIRDLEKEGFDVEDIGPFLADKMFSQPPAEDAPAEDDEGPEGYGPEVPVERVVAEEDLDIRRGQEEQFGEEEEAPRAGEEEMGGDPADAAAAALVQWIGKEVDAETIKKVLWAAGMEAKNSDVVNAAIQSIQDDQSASYAEDEPAEDDEGPEGYGPEVPTS